MKNSTETDDYNSTRRKTDMKKVYLMTMLAILAAPLFGVAAGDEMRKHTGQTMITGWGSFDQTELTETTEWAAGGGGGYFLTDILQIGIEASVYHSEVRIGIATPKEEVAPHEAAPAAMYSPHKPAPSGTIPAPEYTYGYETVKAMYWHGDVCLTAYMPTKQSNPFEPFLGVLAGTYYDDYDRNYSFTWGGKAGINTYFSERAGILAEYRYMRNAKVNENEHYVELGIFYLFN
jgi:hypothetical protein